MSVKVFEPSLPSCYASEQIGLVLANHVGSTTHQDTGRDAQAMANLLQLPVVAFDRPGSAGFLPHPSLATQLSTPAGYLTEMSKVGQKIERELDGLGVNKCIVTGRSAGGLGALALTRCEILSSQVQLLAAEPVGCEEMSVRQGVERMRAYNQFQKRLQVTQDSIISPHNPPLTTLEVVTRLLSMPKDFLYDKFHNQQIWASSAAMNYASYIALNQSTIATLLLFAEHSLVVNDKTLHNIVHPLSLVRDTFTIEVAANTTHASFDDYSYMASLLQPLIDTMK